MNLEGPIDCPLCGEWFQDIGEAVTPSQRGPWLLCFHLGYQHELRVITDSIHWSNVCACGEEFDYIDKMVAHLETVDKDEHWTLFRLASLAE